MRPTPQKPEDVKRLIEEAEHFVDLLTQMWDIPEGLGPKGIAELLDGYRDFDGIRELWDSGDMEHLISLSELFDFPAEEHLPLAEQLSAPRIAYQEVSQGHPRLVWLIYVAMLYGAYWQRANSSNLEARLRRISTKYSEALKAFINLYDDILGP